MTSLVNQLKGQGQDLFDKRGSTLTLWQEIAHNFYPERADFTITRMPGTDFAADLMTSYPIVVRRELGNTYAAMLRPSAKDWFKMRSKTFQDDIDTEGRQWLEKFTKGQKRAMYDRTARLARALSEADQDYAAFGQAVVRVRYMRPRNGGADHLLHNCYHLRDVTWSETEEGEIDTVYRKSCPNYSDIVRAFPKTVHAEIEDLARRKPFDKHELHHVILPFDIYQELDNPTKANFPHPYRSIWFDPKHECVLEDEGAWVMEYVIPRWQTVSGEPCAHSPATVAALPDARLMQAVMQVLLEAGQKATNPPMLGVREAIRSDLDIRAGGFTAVDPDYERDLKEVLAPLNQDIKGLQFGRELLNDLRVQMKDAFFLNKLALPPTVGGRDMTAYEVGQRVQEFIRNALPLFEPVESDYNGRLCDVVKELILRNNPRIVMSLPKSLRGSQFDFTFESPLHEAIDKAKAGQFQEASQIISLAMGLDKSAAFILDSKVAVRDTLSAVVPAAWLHTEDATDQMIAGAQAEEQQAKLLATLQQGAGIAKDIGAAGVDASSAMQTQGPA